MKDAPNKRAGGDGGMAVLFHDGCLWPAAPHHGRWAALFEGRGYRARVQFNPQKNPMRDVITHLNYVHVLVVTVAGFILGCLWLHGPLFGKAWMAEMKFTKESMEAAMKKQGMAKFFIKGFVFTLLGTFGLAALIAAHGSPNWQHGAAFGAFVGLFGPGVRLLNGACWENQSVKLQAINLSHEVVLYAFQGALLGAWH